MKAIVVSIRKWVLFFFLTPITYLPSPSFADTYHIYAAAGALYMVPASLRVGIDPWEFGLLTPTAYGANKIFAFSENYYSAFGLVLGYGTIPGVYGALGMKVPLLWGFGLRGELAAAALIDGFLSGEGQLGLTWAF